MLAIKLESRPPDNKQPISLSDISLFTTASLSKDLTLSNSEFALSGEGLFES